MKDHWRLFLHSAVGFVLLYVGFWAGSQKSPEYRYNKWNDAALDGELSMIQNKFALMSMRQDETHKALLSALAMGRDTDLRLDEHVGHHQPLQDGGADGR